MGIVVDHEQRKTVILKKALDVIIEEGYEDATFQKIADRCGITRTTLYIYFKNKREIFLWSIKQLTEGLEIALQDIIGDTSRSCKERLLAVLEGIVHGCIENRQLFQVILAYLIQIQKTGKNPGDRVRRRIVRLRHLLSTLLIEGKKNGTDSAFSGFIMVRILKRGNRLSQNFQKFTAAAINVFRSFYAYRIQLF